MKLILSILVSLFFWALVHGGTRKKMPHPKILTIFGTSAKWLGRHIRRLL